MGKKRLEQINAFKAMLYQNQGVSERVIVAKMCVKYGLALRTAQEMLGQLCLAGELLVEKGSVFVHPSKIVSVDVGKRAELSEAEVVEVVASAEADHFFETIGAPVEKGKDSGEDKENGGV